LKYVNETRASRASFVDQEKKTSEYGSVKNSSVSAKVSDGTSSLAKTSGSAKISDRVDFVESVKSSMCRGSTSSDVSDESSCSSFSSSISKPHKANDLRWEAIQVIRARDGALGLGHFRLLKRLGCGDIGSVYLSELSGTKCYFAMKVMDLQYHIYSVIYPHLLLKYVSACTPFFANYVLSLQMLLLFLIVGICLSTFIFPLSSTTYKGNVTLLLYWLLI
jgi:hypothetical protein